MDPFPATYLDGFPGWEGVRAMPLTLHFGVGPKQIGGSPSAPQNLGCFTRSVRFVIQRHDLAPQAWFTDTPPHAHTTPRMAGAWAPLEGTTLGYPPPSPARSSAIRNPTSPRWNICFPS